MSDGLPLFGVAQLAVDTKVVSALHSDGRARPRAANTPGVALEAARRRKERRYAELVLPTALSRLVVFGVEVGGRWSQESQDLISQLARAHARQEQPLLRCRAEQGWRLRWGSMVSCVVARAVADSLLGPPRYMLWNGICWQQVLLGDAKSQF